MEEVSQVFHLPILACMYIQDEEEVFATRKAWGETWASFQEWRQAAASSFRPWSTSIQEVEGRHGVP